MRWMNDVHGYGLVSQLLHWLVALLIVATIPLGLYMVELKQSALSAGEMDRFARAAQLFDIHKAIGVSIFALVVVRLAWRLFSAVPALPAGSSAVVRVGSTISHVALYALMFSMPITGYMLSSAEGFAVNVWGLFEIPVLPVLDSAHEDLLRLVHRTGAFIFAAFIGLHIAAALYHGLLLRDGVLARIIPGLRVRTR